MDRGEKAQELFHQGYNCAQALVLAFSDVTGLDPTTAARLTSGFGGGISRMREVCGAVSGMAMVAGILYGYDQPGDQAGKQQQYARVQQLAASFREEFGTIICRELLQNPPSDPNPTPRTQEFYAQRPCGRYICEAARILEKYIESHPGNHGPIHL